MDIFSSIGTQEVLVILLVALLIVGPTKVAEFGKTLGNVSRNLRKATTDLTTNLQREISAEEEKIKRAALDKGETGKKA